MEPLLERLRTRLAPHGLNLVGTTEIAAYDAVVPPAWVLGPRAGDARTAVVIGNGGAAFWAAFRRYLAADPAAGRMADPLDAFTRHVVGEAIAPLRDELRAPRVVYPFEIQTLPVSFVHLAECAGLGRRSLLGVLVHPEYGTWMALRAAILVPFALAAPRPADGFDPCPTCVERPCIPACPVGAVGPAGWDVPRCAAHRIAVPDDCGSGCHSRIACVFGRDHRYPPDAQAFHQRGARGSLNDAPGPPNGLPGAGRR
jgi:hypothetical protein